MNKSNINPKTDNILVVAAEASSCMYAKLFMKSWKSFYPDTRFFGVGDRDMYSQGMECVGFAEDMAVVGIQEVLAHWKDIKKSFHSLVNTAREKRPRFALLLDYPGFNLRLAPRLKKLGIPVVYYLSPQLWAWKEGRVKSIKQFVDDMMVVFPFEVDFYKKHGVQAHFVGHPLVEIVHQEILLPSSRRPPWHSEAYLSKGIGSVFSSKKTGKPVLGLMPGSRKSEIQHNLKIQWMTARKLMENCDIDVRFLVAPTFEVDFLKQQLPECAGSMKFLKGKPTAMIQKCDLILAASGTATLQVALCEKPMIVMYRMNRITAFLAKFLVGHLSHYCIVNIIAGHEVVPEFMQSKAQPQILAKALEKILKSRDHREKMILSLKKISKDLGHGGATENLVHFLNKKYGDKSL